MGVTSLSLRGNSIGDAGAAAIAEALKTNTAVTFLRLDYNSIGDAGAAAIAEALTTNTAVTSLNLNSNRIGDAGAVEIADLKQSNLDKDAKITELAAELASAGLSRYLTITNDDFINLAEVAAFDASGNQLTPVHASMNNEYGHDHGANKCIAGINSRGPGSFIGWSGDNMCHSQPSD